MSDFVSRVTSDEMTWTELARAWLPDAPEEHLDWVLWNETPFPFGSIEDVEKMLASYTADPVAHQARIDASLEAMSKWEEETE